MEKLVFDDDCHVCKYGHYYPAHLTADPYYSTPEECECDLNFECPFLEDTDACEEEDYGV